MPGGLLGALGQIGSLAGAAIAPANTVLAARMAGQQEEEDRQRQQALQALMLQRQNRLDTQEQDYKQALIDRARDPRVTGTLLEDGTWIPTGGPASMFGAGGRPGAPPSAAPGAFNPTPLGSGDLTQALKSGGGQQQPAPIQTTPNPAVPSGPSATAPTPTATAPAATATGPVGGGRVLHKMSTAASARTPAVPIQQQTQATIDSLMAANPQMSLDTANARARLMHGYGAPQLPGNILTTVQGPQGESEIVSGKNRGPLDLKTTGFNKPLAGGPLASGRVSIAVNTIEQANPRMDKFEDDYLGGKAKISEADRANAIAMFNAQPNAFGIPTSGAHVQSMAEATLNRSNPAYAQYVRDAKANSLAERLMSPKGGSNQMGTAEQALSSVGPGANGDLVAGARSFRAALHSALRGALPPGAQGTGAPAAPAAPATPAPATPAPAAAKPAADYGPFGKKPE